MDKPIPKKQKQKGMKRLILFVASIAFILLAIVSIRFLFKPSASDSELVIATVTEGAFENTFSASGLVKPTQEILITSPMGTQIKSVINKTGSQVKKGDKIVILNADFASLEYSKLSDEVNLKENNVKKLSLNLEKNIRDIELDNQIKELEIKSLYAQLEDINRLYTIGGSTQEEVEKVKQAIAIAKLEKKKLENELQYRKNSFQVDVNNEELHSSIQKKTLTELGQKIALTNVTAPVDGILTYVNESIGTQVELGSPLARIANVSSFMIEGAASDRYTKRIQIGLPVRVRINKDILQGTIDQILPTIENNTVKFTVLLDNNNIDKLKANMRVELFIVEDKIDKTKTLIKGAGFKSGKVQELFVVQGEQLIKREVQIGVENENAVEILSGLQSGDRVVISDMSKYKNHTVVSLKSMNNE